MQDGAKAAAHLIRVNGKHRPRQSSTWAPKALATIRVVADTLEDRATVVKVQREPPAATVARLRRRVSDELAALRSGAVRCAAVNFDLLVDPEPQLPDGLNDRASDNWRPLPLLAIAELAGGEWSKQARRAACLLSGESQDGAILSNS